LILRTEEGVQRIVAALLMALFGVMHCSESRP
jgi:hypothetical protein